MKVLHLCFADAKGGGAIGAYRLHRAMCDSGVHSNMLVIQKNTDDPTVFTALTPRFVKRFRRNWSWHRRVLELHRTPNSGIRSVNIFPTHIDRMINDSDADVVQLHWIGNNTISIAEIARIEKPVFMKLADMWAFSGVEHYPAPGDPERYRSGFRPDNRVDGERGLDLNRWVWAHKRRRWRGRRLTIVTPSRWLGRTARESIIFRNAPVHVIPNPIDLDLYAPQDGEAARAAFDLSPSKRLILFGALGPTTTRRKGHHRLLSALLHLEQMVDPSAIELVVFGGDETSTNRLGDFTIRHLERTHDERLLTQLYACGDVFVLPSELDNLPNVITEAMACGVPCVGFAVGGLPDQIDHETNGYLAQPYDTLDLARGIAWVLNQDRDALARAARRKACLQAAPRMRVLDYLDMYNFELARGGHGPSRIGGAVTGQLYDKGTSEKDLSRTERVVFLEPSVMKIADNSHNYPELLAFSRVFDNAGMMPIWLINEGAEVENPLGPTFRVFDYTIYDRFRATLDTARAYATSKGAETVPCIEGSRDSHPRAFEAVDSVLESLELQSTDLIVVPTADRFTVEALLHWSLLNASDTMPTVHLLFMYEDANWMTGGYPYADMVARLRRSGLLGAKIFLYTETAGHRAELAGRAGVEVGQFPFPVDTDVAPSVTDGDPAGEACTVVALGRGRRDKGFHLLPEIVERFGELYHGPRPVRFLIQEARAVDGLAEASNTLRALDPVTMLEEFLPEHDYLRTLRAADVVLLPYDKDIYRRRGSGIARQAMAYAKPVVCTDDTAIAEVLVCGNGSSGSTPAELAQALCRVIGDPTVYRDAAERAAATYRTGLFDNDIIRNARNHPLRARRTTLFVAAFDGEQLPEPIRKATRRLGRDFEPICGWYIETNRPPRGSARLARGMPHLHLERFRHHRSALLCRPTSRSGPGRTNRRRRCANQGLGRDRDPEPRTDSGDRGVLECCAPPTGKSAGDVDLSHLATATRGIAAGRPQSNGAGAGAANETFPRTGVVIALQRILVTGGAGFIGTNLVERLLCGSDMQILVLDDLSNSSGELSPSRRVELVEGSILDEAVVSRCMSRVDAVVHLAAHTRVIESIEDPLHNLHVNVLGTCTILEAMRRHRVTRIVSASSGGAIVADVEPPMHEDIPPQPTSPYGASKLAVEGYLSAYAGSYAVDALSLRFSNIYGIYSRSKSSVVAHFIKEIVRHRRITVYGDGSQTRDFLYVSDLCEGIVAGLESGQSGVLQLGMGKPTSVARLIEHLRETLPLDFEVTHTGFRPGEVVHTYCDIGRARERLGFNPTTELPEGIGLTWTWFQDNFAEIAGPASS